jgi:hypothetical protein
MSIFRESSSDDDTDYISDKAADSETPTPKPKFKKASGISKSGQKSPDRFKVLEARVAQLETFVAEGKKRRLALSRRIKQLEQLVKVNSNETPAISKSEDGSTESQTIEGEVAIPKAEFSLIPEGRRKGVYSLFLKYMLKCYPDPVSWLGLPKGSSPAKLANELLELMSDDDWASLTAELKKQHGLVINHSILYSLFRKKTKENISKSPSPETCEVILDNLGLDKILHSSQE